MLFFKQASLCKFSMHIKIDLLIVAGEPKEGITACRPTAESKSGASRTEGCTESAAESSSIKGSLGSYTEPGGGKSGAGSGAGCAESAAQSSSIKGSPGSRTEPRGGPRSSRAAAGPERAAPRRAPAADSGPGSCSAAAATAGMPQRFDPIRTLIPQPCQSHLQADFTNTGI